MAASDRTAEKLRFARALLDDLRARPGKRGDDLQRAREEAFLFHLHGARDAFLHEINERYKCGLSLKDVKVAKLRKWFRTQGLVSSQLQELEDLEDKAIHTLYRLKEWRDTSTHRGGVPRTFYVGGEADGEHHFHDPQTGKPTGKHITEDFDDMLTEVAKLIDGWRATLP